MRRLLRGAHRGMLGTSLSQEGWPFVSLVSAATDTDGSPVFLLSGLAIHTRNILLDHRASLFIETAGNYADPLETPRVAVLGRVAPVSSPVCRRRFLAQHPEAAQYADFADFGIFRMNINRIYWVGGFGRSGWYRGTVLCDGELARQIAIHEEAIIARMNAEHRLMIDALAARHGGQKARGWQLVAIDPDGVDLARGDQHCRAPFTATIERAEDMTSALVRLINSAMG